MIHSICGVIGDQDTFESEIMKSGHPTAHSNALLPPAFGNGPSRPRGGVCWDVEAISNTGTFKLFQTLPPLSNLMLGTEFS